MERDGSIMIWDSEKQIFNEWLPNEILNALLSENSVECHLFLSWLPYIKSVFLYRRKRMEIVFIDGMKYNITKMPHLYDMLFSMRHGM